MPHPGAAPPTPDPRYTGGSGARVRDTDLDDLSEQPSEDEVLAPRLADSLTDRTPTPTRRRPRTAPSGTTTPMLVGTALAVVVVISAAVLAVSLILGVWFSG